MRGSEIFHRRAFERTQDVVGQRAGSEAEMVGVEPFVAEHLADYRVVGHGVFGGAHASGGLEADAASGRLVVFADAAAHHVCGLERGPAVDLARRGLDEVGVAVHGQYRGVPDQFGRLETSGLEYHLQFGATGRVLELDDLVAELLVIAVEQHSDVEHDVNLVGASLAGQRDVGDLDGLERLARRESGGDDTNVDALDVEVRADNLREIAVDADGRHMRILRVIVLEVVDTLCETRHAALAVFGAESREVDAAQQEAVDLRSLVFTLLLEDSGDFSLHLGVVDGHSALGYDLVVSVHNFVFSWLHMRG